MKKLMVLFLFLSFSLFSSPFLRVIKCNVQIPEGNFTYIVFADPNIASDQSDTSDGLLVVDSETFSVAEIVKLSVSDDTVKVYAPQFGNYEIMRDGIKATKLVVTNDDGEPMSTDCI